MDIAEFHPAVTDTETAERFRDKWFTLDAGIEIPEHRAIQRRVMGHASGGGSEQRVDGPVPFVFPSAAEVTVGIGGRGQPWIGEVRRKIIACAEEAAQMRFRPEGAESQ